MPRDYALYVRIPTELIDDDWTEKDLRDNAVDYITMLLDDPVYQDPGFVGSHEQPYRFDHMDITLWTSIDDLIADAKEGNID